MPWWRRKGGRGKRKGGAPPPFPCPIRTRKGRGARPPPGSFPLLPRGPCRPNNPPGGSWAIVGLCGEEERRPGQGRAPLPPSPNRTREGGRRPPFPSSLPPLSPLLLLQLGKKGVLLPVGVGLLLARPKAGRTSPFDPLYTGAGGTPERQQLIIDLLAVCDAPLQHITPR